MHEGSHCGNRKGFVWIILGLLLVALGILLAACNLLDGMRAERAARQVIRTLEAVSEPASEPMEPTAELETISQPYMEMPVKTVDGLDLIGILQIPALELELPVISQWSYSDLKTAPCRYSGSIYQNDLIICGHNYPTHFGGLAKLLPGDTISFTDMDDNTFLFEMSQRETLPPTALDEMEAGDWDLTLFTCTPGGQSRVTIRCTRSYTD